MQDFNPSWHHGILYADRPSKEEQFSRRPFLWRKKKTNVEGDLNLKLLIDFMEITHENSESEVQYSKR